MVRQGAPWSLPSEQSTGALFEQFSAQYDVHASFPPLLSTIAKRFFARHESRGVQRDIP